MIKNGCIIKDNVLVGMAEENAALIPEGVQVIRDYAFKSLKDPGRVLGMYLPDSLLRIGEGAFVKCYHIPDLYIPKNVEYIDEGFADHCSGMFQIRVHSENMYFSDFNGVLYNKDQTELIRCPEGYENLNNVFSENVRVIKKGAFKNCDDFEIKIPKSVEVIEEGAFENLCAENIYADKYNPCFSSVNGVLYNKNRTKLVKFPIKKRKIQNNIFSKEIQKIGRYAFEKSWIEDIVLPEGVKEIEDYAFAFCEHLKKVSLPKGLIGLGDYAFVNCQELKKINIPESVENIGRKVLYWCLSLETSSYDLFCNRNDLGFDKQSDYKKTKDFIIENDVLVKYTGKDESVIIPDGIRKIGRSAFNGSGISWVQFPESLEEIGDWAFNECDLEYIYIPDNVIKIGEHAFDENWGLRTVRLSENITEISDGLFAMCNFLYKVNIPKSVKRIGDEAFSSVTDGLKKIIIPEGVESIGKEAFYDCGELETVILPSTLKEIKDCAFGNCPNLKNIKIPANVKLGKDIFIIKEE